MSGINESIIEQFDEENQLSISSNHRPSDSGDSPKKDQELKDGCDKMLYDIQKRLIKKMGSINPYVKIDYNSDSSSSVFSRSDNPSSAL